MKNNIQRFKILTMYSAAVIFYFAASGYKPAYDIGDIIVNDAKGLVSEIKLYPEAGETQELGGEIGELVYDGTSLKITINNVPAGTYKRINFALYKPGENDNFNPEFGSSASGTYSLIVNGIFSDKPFTYRSQMTSQKIMDIEPPMVTSGGTVTIELETDPTCWFKCNKEILSPYDASNSGRIDRNIVVSFKKAKAI